METVDIRGARDRLRAAEHRLGEVLIPRHDVAIVGRSVDVMALFLCALTSALEEGRLSIPDDGRQEHTWSLQPGVVVALGRYRAGAVDQLAISLAGDELCLDLSVSVRRRTAVFWEADAPVPSVTIEAMNSSAPSALGEDAGEAAESRRAKRSSL